MIHSPNVATTSVLNIMLFDSNIWAKIEFWLQKYNIFAQNKKYIPTFWQLEWSAKWDNVTKPSSHFMRHHLENLSAQYLRSNIREDGISQILDTEWLTFHSFDHWPEDISFVKLCHTLFGIYCNILALWNPVRWVIAPSLGMLCMA